MSKLYNKYLELKESDSHSLYLFKSGMFYIFLDKDAEVISKKLNLKLINFNGTVFKCGFPINSLTKYTDILNENGIDYKIIDGEIITHKKQYIENQNIQNYLEQIKKTDVNKLTPIKAFELVCNLQKLLRRKLIL